MATPPEPVNTTALPKNNDFYRNYYHWFIIGSMIAIVLMLSMVFVVLYQISHRPLPIFTAMQPDGHKMNLTSFDEPNLLPDTILRWATQAATVSYTFDFYNYKQQLEHARPFFTPAGWDQYLISANKLITTIVKNALIVNGVVSGTPVISNQGPIPGQGFVWRVQIPFIVTYQSANTQSQRRYFVILTLIRVPTNINPQGIGIDQFVMV